MHIAHAGYVGIIYPSLHAHTLDTSTHIDHWILLLEKTESRLQREILCEGYLHIDTVPRTSHAFVAMPNLDGIDVESG